MILTIPSFFLSATAAHRVFRVHSVQREIFRITASQSLSLANEREVNSIEFAKMPLSPVRDDVHLKSAGAEFPGDEDRDVNVVPSRMPHADEMTCAAAAPSKDDTRSPRSPVVSLASSIHSPKTPEWDKSRINGRASLPLSGESSRPCFVHE